MYKDYFFIVCQIVSILIELARPIEVIVDFGVKVSDYF